MLLFPIVIHALIFVLSTMKIRIICMCWEGKDVINQGRQMLGETQPLASKPGSIRGDYSIDLGRNICHGSDSPEAAAHELGMWFSEGVNDWKKTVDAWVYEG
jgi:nucleoside-diphosphate kinase